MLNNQTKRPSKLFSLLLAVSLIISALVSCFPEPDMSSKDDIRANIDAVISESSTYEYVYQYLSDFGISNFDASKFVWVEARFKRYFNFGDGLPSVKEHARLTAIDFIDNYYDKIDISSKDKVTDALLTCYVNAIGEKYSVYRTPTENDDYTSDMSGKFGGIGVVIEYDHTAETLQVTTVYIDSPAEDAGILPGDYIIGVDGRTIEEVGYLNIVNYVRGEIGTTTTVKIKRGDDILYFDVLRAEIEEKTVAYSISEDNIGYIEIVGFKSNTYAQFVEAIDAMEEANVAGIIFDLRGNPGGYVYSVRDMLSYLIPTGHTIVSYHYKNSSTEVLESIIDTHPTKKDPQNSSEYLQEDHVCNIPMVVLCNEYTASAGELFTAAVRDYTDMGLLNAKIVGSTTYGKGIMQTSWAYTDGSSITMTTAYYNPPCGINYHGTGVTPDREVLNEIQDGKIIDKQLEAAYEELELLINSN